MVDAFDLLPPEIWTLIYQKILESRTSTIPQDSKAFMGTCEALRSVAESFLWRNVQHPVRLTLMNQLDAIPEDLERHIPNVSTPVGLGLSPFIFFLRPTEAIRYVLNAADIQNRHDYFLDCAIPEGSTPIEEMAQIIGCPGPQCPGIQDHIHFLETFKYEDAFLNFLDWNRWNRLPEHLLLTAAKTIYLPLLGHLVTRLSHSSIISPEARKEVYKWVFSYRHDQDFWWNVFAYSKLEALKEFQDDIKDSLFLSSSEDREGLFQHLILAELCLPGWVWDLFLFL